MVSRFWDVLPSYCVYNQVGSFDEGFGPAGRLGLEGSPADSLISELGRKLAYRDF